MGHFVDNILAEKNLTMTSLSPALNPTATTLNGTLTLTALSNFLQVISGTATGFKVQLPDATTLTTGWEYDIWNLSNQNIIINYNDTTTFTAMPPGSRILLVLNTNGTTNGVWIYQKTFTGTASGILNYYVSSSETFTLAAPQGTGDILIGGTTPMQVTPITGTYACWYDGSISVTGNGTTIRTVFYRDSGIWTDSLRTLASSTSTLLVGHTTAAIIPVNGAQTIAVRLARNNGSITITGRSMILIRLGD